MDQLLAALKRNYNNEGGVNNLMKALSEQFDAHQKYLDQLKQEAAEILAKVRQLNNNNGTTEGATFGPLSGSPVPSRIAAQPSALSGVPSNPGQQSSVQVPIKRGSIEEILPVGPEDKQTTQPTSVAAIPEATPVSGEMGSTPTVQGL